MKNKKTESVLILDNIRSIYNVGAIFRTADAIGVSKLYLVGITPGPLDRFGRARADVAKSALGAEKTVLWESVKTIAPLIKKLKKEGYVVIALEQDERSIDYKKIKQSPKMAVVLGEEVHGLSSSVLKMCDHIAEIPMQGELARHRPKDYGGKESLNVSVATGVALFRILDR